MAIPTGKTPEDIFLQCFDKLEFLSDVTKAAHFETGLPISGCGAIGQGLILEDIITDMRNSLDEMDREKRRDL